MAKSYEHLIGSGHTGPESAVGMRGAVSRRGVLKMGMGGLAALALPGANADSQTATGTETVMKTSDETIAAYDKFDTHMHALGSKAALLPVLDALGVKRAVNLSYSGFRSPEELLAYEQELLVDLKREASRFCFIPAFNVTRFLERDYCSGVIAKLDRDISANGAVGVKIWKDLGMMLQDADGKYVFCDDDRFRPIFDFVASKGLVIYAHIADPLAGWLPLDTPSPHAGYFRKHPEFHWYGKPGKPSHEEILGHRDALIARYPDTVFVAAHLASLEHDLREVAKFLDRYPNARVDTAARFKDLMGQPDEQVRAFFVQYQDRILYGTDWDYEAGAFGKTPEEVGKKRRACIENYGANFLYFEKTLGLPPEVLRKFYFENANGLFSGREALR